MSEAPQYFKDFLVDFNEGRDEVTEIKSSLEEARKEWPDEAALNRAATSRNTDDIRHLKDHAALVDKFEVLIRGLPPGHSMSYDEAMRKLLSVLDLNPHILEKAEYRE